MAKKSAPVALCKHRVPKTAFCKKCAEEKRGK